MGEFMDLGKNLRCIPDESAYGVLRQDDLFFYGGVDGGTAVNVYGSPVSEDILQELDRARLEAVQGRRAVGRELGGVSCTVQAAPKGPIGYSYMVNAGGVVLYIHRNPCDQIPSVKVEYGWESCDRFQLTRLHEAVHGWLERLGVCMEREHISRLDVQISASLKLDPFWLAVDEHRIRCRQRVIDRRESGVPETITFGSHRSPIMFRSYDKVREVFGNSERKYNALSDRFETAGYNVRKQPVTRFEFEVKRPVLRKLGISSFSDLEKNGRNYVDYLFGWLRFTGNYAGAKHSERERVLPEWETVHKMFDQVFCGSGPAFHRKRPHRGGPMTVEQCRRTESTVSTLMANLLYQEVLRNGEDPKALLTSLTSRILRSAVPKYLKLSQTLSSEYPENVLEKIDPHSVKSAKH